MPRQNKDKGLSQKPMPCRYGYSRCLNRGKTFFASPIKHRFKHIDLKIMVPEEMLFNFFQQITIHMDEGAATFAFQMEMFPAFFFTVYVLITGAFVIKQNIFTELSFGREFLKMPVYGGLPNSLFRIFKVAYYLINRYMTARQGLHIFKNTLALPGVIICRTFTHHRLVFYVILSGMSI
jgi:hypothetical protein